VSTVYASRGGRAFHAAHDCRALRAGHDLWDFDDWSGYATKPTTIEAAMGAGKLPCGACLPELLAGWFRTPCEDDFGHEPVRDPIAGAHGWPQYDVCARCGWGDVYYDGSPVKERVSVAWPCTSAVVLGLVPRPGGAS
jgi:hypothetical protein